MSVLGSCLLRNGSCLLRNTDNVELQDSHIVSKWNYRRLLATDSADKTRNLVQFRDGLSQLSSKQVSTYLLCKNCEGHFGKQENAASRLLLQTDGSFPLRDKSQLIFGDKNYRLVEWDQDHVDTITHYAVGIFWRGDVAQQEPIVHLGAARAMIRQYLIGQAAFPESVDLVVSLFHSAENSPLHEYYIVPPETKLSDCHQFMGCGARFVLFTNGNIPPDLLKYSLTKTSRALVVPDTEVSPMFAATMMAARPVGRLAKVL